MEGTGEVQGSAQARLIYEGDTAVVKKQQWHKIRNLGKIPLVIVETWIGEYLSEDDIERWPCAENVTSAQTDGTNPADL